MLRRRIGCRAHPPRVTPERSMTVVVEAIIAGLSVSACVCARAPAGKGELGVFFN